MKTKEVICQFEYANFDDLERMLENLKNKIMEGKEFFEDVIYYGDNKKILHFIQKYKKTRNFKIVNSDSIIIRSNV